MKPGGLTRWGWPAALLIAYVVTARAAHELASVGSFSPFWPPSGIALAGVVLLGRRALVAVALASLIHGLSVGNAPWVAAGEALANTLQPAAGAWLFRRFRVDRGLERVRDMALFAGPVTLIAAAAGTVVGATFFWLGGAFGDANPAMVYLMWWTGDAIGILFLAPPILVAASGQFAVLRERPFEATVLFASLAVILVILFFPPRALASAGWPLSFLVAPFLLWSALRLGLAGASVALLLAGVACAIGTVRGLGPFAYFEEILPRLWVAQLYLLAKAFLAFTVASADAERRAAIRLREDFLSAASHELKTPLTTMKTGVQLARQRLDAGRQIPTRSIERMERQVERLGRLIENLLDVSRLTAGRMTLAIEEVDLAEVAREAVVGLGHSASQAGCVVTVHAERPVMGRWDRVRIEQVLMNLLANAFIYAPGRSVEVTAERSNDTARLTVRDHGSGIAAGDRERIFQRFERGSLQGVGGLGLGLFLSREIVEAQGGRIGVECEPGNGSTFVVELPVSPPERVARKTLQPRPWIFNRLVAKNAASRPAR